MLAVLLDFIFLETDAVSSVYHKKISVQLSLVHSHFKINLHTNVVNKLQDIIHRNSRASG